MSLGRLFAVSSRFTVVVSLIHCFLSYCIINFCAREMYKVERESDIRLDCSFPIYPIDWH